MNVFANFFNQIAGVDNPIGMKKPGKGNIILEIPQCEVDYIKEGAKPAAIELMFTKYGSVFRHRHRSNNLNPIPGIQANIAEGCKLDNDPGRGPRGATNWMKAVWRGVSESIRGWQRFEVDININACEKCNCVCPFNTPGLTDKQGEIVPLFIQEPVPAQAPAR